MIYIKSDSTSTSEASSSRSTTPSSSQASSGRCTPTNHAHAGGMRTSTSAHTALSRPDADKVHASLQSEFLRSVSELAGAIYPFEKAFVINMIKCNQSGTTGSPSPRDSESDYLSMKGPR